MPLPFLIELEKSFKGCISSLKVGHHHLDLIKDAEQTISTTKGCRVPYERCSPLICKNNGICHQGWTRIFCDCSFTAYSGQYCEDLGTTYLFTSDAIYYEFTEGQRPSTNNDVLVVGFTTHNSNGVLLNVQCGVEGDYLTIFIGGGYLQLRYNLGSRDHHLGYFDIFVNDGRFHIVKLTRNNSHITLYLDDHMPVKYHPSPTSNELYILNMQQRISIGASFNIFHSLGSIRKKHRRSLKIFDEFTGKITGVNFNGLKILDLFAKNDPHVFRIGNPKLIHMAAEQTFSTRTPSTIGDENRGFFVHDSLDCLSLNDHAGCESEVSEEGFFTPVLQKSIVSSTTSSSTIPTTTTLLRITTADKEIVPERELSIQHSTTLLSTTTTQATYTTLTSNRTTKISHHYFSSSNTKAPTCATTFFKNQQNNFLTYTSSTFFHKIEEKFTKIDTKLPTTPKIEKLDQNFSSTFTTNILTKKAPIRWTPQMYMKKFSTITEKFSPIKFTTRSTTTTTQKPKLELINESDEEDETEGDKKNEKVEKEYKNARIVSKTEPDELDTLWNDIEKPAQKTRFSTMLSKNQPKITEEEVYQTANFLVPLENQLPNPQPTISYTYESENEEKENIYGDSVLPEGDAIDKPYLVTPDNSIKKQKNLKPTKKYAQEQYTLSGFRSLAPLTATTPFISTRAKAGSSFQTTLYAVRPTTPMGDSLLTTYKTPTTANGDFPRTALISIASISVIVIIAIVVFCVFRCRQSGPPMDGPYPMVCSGKAPSATGYTPIPSDNSPQMHAHHYDAQCAPMTVSSTLPTQMRNGGYQPLKGSVIPNGNSMNILNGQGGVLQNGGTHSIDPAKKKDFKEWYV